MNKSKLQKINLRKIKQEDNLNAFTSYEQDLVEFLREDALTNQQKGISVTFLFHYNNNLVSYITLLIDRIDLKGNLRSFYKDKEITYSSLPALKIGRLCVDNNHLRKGLGRYMVRIAIILAKKIMNNIAGCRFLTVDAKNNDSVLRFYKKCGFKILRNNKNTISLYADLKLLEY